MNYHYKLISILFFVFGMLANVNSQDATISGVVTDGEGPLIGATVVVMGTNIGDVTDIDGKYALSVSPGTHVVQVSFLGYNPIKTTVVVESGSNAIADFEMSQGVLVDEVVVTGTRSRPRTAINSPVPIDNFSAVELERQGNSDLTETIRNLVPSYTATPLTGDGAAFVRPTSLRGLPPDEVLVLINSRRRHRSALISHLGAAMNAGAHAVDIGHIPGIAIKNLEVLRDGAAAQYGSDAIAGVMNFILKDASEGSEFQVQSGVWFGNDKNPKNGGEIEYKISGNVGLPLTDKGFLNLSGEYMVNPELSRGQQHAAAIDVPGAQNPAMNWGRPESRGLRTMWNAGIDLTDKIKFYSYGNYSNVYGNYSFFYRAPGKSGVLMTLPKDPNDPSKGNFSFADEYPAGFTPRFEGFQTDISGVLGFKTTLDNGLNIDLSFYNGSNRINYVLNNSINPSWGRFSQRVFRPGDLKQSDRNFNLDFSKEFSERVHLAAGVERRNETYTMFQGDLQSWQPGPWARVSELINPETGENYGQPGIAANGFKGTSPDEAGVFTSSNWAGYLDGEFDISDAWLLQAAVRYEDFDKFGNTTNYKLATRYRVFDKLTLRGAYSTGFRAPTAGQANVTTISTSFDGVTGMQVEEGTVRPTDPIAVELGGKALTPEQSKNFSVGLTSNLSPSFKITADAYQILVDDRIVKSRNLPVENNPNFSEVSFYTNALNTQTRGLDVVANWRNEKINFSVAYNYNETKVLSQEQVNGKNPVSDGFIFNIENNLPKHRASINLSYNFSNRFSALVRNNYYGGTIDERGLREVVGPENLVDLELNYRMSDNFNIVLGANNLFNTYPDEIETRLSQGMPYPRRTPIGYNGGIAFIRLVYRQ